MVRLSVLEYIFQRFNHLACLSFGQGIDCCFFVIFVEEITKMTFIPAKIPDQMFDEQLLPEGEAVFIDAVLSTGGKGTHQTSEPFLINILCRADTGLTLQDIPVLVIGQAQFPFDNMNHGKFFSIQCHGCDPCLLYIKKTSDQFISLHLRIISRQKAGRSEGILDVIRFPSTTTSSSR